MKEYFIVPKTHMEKLEKLQGRDLAPYSNLLDNKALTPDTTLSLINSYLKNERELASRLSTNQLTHSGINVNQPIKNNASTPAQSIVYPSTPPKTYTPIKNNASTPHQPIIKSMEGISLPPIKNDSFIDESIVTSKLSKNDDDDKSSDASFESTNQSANESLNENSDEDLLNISTTSQSKLYLDRFILLLGSKKQSRSALIRVFSNLINDKIVKIDSEGIITYIPTGSYIPGTNFIHALLRKNGSVNTYRNFLVDIRPHIPNGVIENDKYMAIYIIKQSPRGGSINVKLRKNIFNKWIIL